MSPDDFPPGSVWLVGAGPGDPELVTRKAERLLRAADIVFHDALVGPGILELIPVQTALVSVGKPALPQEQSQDRNYFTSRASSLARARSSRFQPIHFGAVGAIVRQAEAAVATNRMVINAFACWRG